MFYSEFVINKIIKSFCTICLVNFVNSESRLYKTIYLTVFCPAVKTKFLNRGTMLRLKFLFCG